MKQNKKLKAIMWAVVAGDKILTVRRLRATAKIDIARKRKIGLIVHAAKVKVEEV